jgi:magnesium-protoporphyrin O-methyltransferase
MTTSTYTRRYEQRRSEIQTYFDQTAAEAWSRLTSDAPVGRIRQTVRAGRDQMRETLLSWLPQDLTGKCLLDAGCGTGAFAVEAARRGARVVATDLSPTLVSLASERVPDELKDLIDFRVGDMSSQDLGEFDHIVAMDSLIHYTLDDVLHVVNQMTGRARRSVLFTFAPSTPLLACMHSVGRLFPRSNRAPSIQPVSEALLQGRLANNLFLAGWRVGRGCRIKSGFYTSQAMELEAW